MEAEVISENRPARLMSRACGERSLLRRDTLTEGSRQVRARRRKVRGLVLPVAAALFALPAAGGQKAGQDANALVRKMIATYQAANTISGSSEAKMLISGAQYIQRTTWKYRKPNKLFMSSVDPVAGTFTLWLNDSIIVIYSGRQNIYTKRTTQPTLAGCRSPSGLPGTPSRSPRIIS
jgi:hypothetical protein